MLAAGAFTVAAARVFEIRTVFAPPTQPSAFPLPAPEIFTPHDGLTISLRSAAPTVRLGEPLALTLRFENRGRERLSIVPRPVWPVFKSVAQPMIASASGDAPSADARRLPIIITSDKLAALAPGEHWDMPLDGFSRQPIRLAPGEYTVGVTYINSPDYQYVHYDPYTMPAGIWEGMLEAPPIRVSVTPQSAERVERHTELLESDRADDLTLELLALSDAGGVRALIQQLPLLERSRLRILLALRRVDTIPISDLIAAIDRLPPYERGSLIASTEFSILLREWASC